MRYNFYEKDCATCFHGLNVKKNKEDEGVWNCTNFEDTHLEVSPPEFTCPMWESYIKN